MSVNQFFELEQEEQREIIATAALQSRWNAAVLEKDLWVVWSLDALFQQPDAPTYAFKGGTSLSKVYSAIDRFSEDVDVTVSTQDERLLGDRNPLDETWTKNQRKKLNEEAQKSLVTYVGGDLLKYLQSKVAELPEGSRPVIEAEESNIRIEYPLLFGELETPGYMLPHVLLEFGTRGTTEPSEPHEVTTYLASTSPVAGLILPTASVMAMRVERTFWEKATLAHAEITRAKVKFRDRYSRHWYDLHQISDKPNYRKSSLEAQDILAQVIDIKSKQFHGGGVEYEACGRGKLRLVPEGELLGYLRDDYGQMRVSGMLSDSNPTFDEIIEAVAQLELEANDIFRGVGH